MRVPYYLPWLFMALLACFVQWINVMWRSQAPPAQSIPQAAGHHGISGLEVYGTGQFIESATLINGTDADELIYKYIHDKLQDLQTLNGSNRLFLQTPRHDLGNLSLSSIGSCNIELATNAQIVAKVPGMFASSVVLSTQYDSQPGLFGAPVGIILDILRAVVTTPSKPRNTLIAVFNNGRVDAPCSPKWSVRSNLTHHYMTQAFVHLGDGGGDRAILSRATDIQLASQYAIEAPRPEMNNIVGFAALSRDSTDYDTFQEANVPGVEIAFVQNTSEKLSADRVQLAGSNVVAFTKSLLDMPFLTRLHAHAGQPVFFDLVGRWSFALSLDMRSTLVLFTFLAAGGVLMVFASTFQPNKKVYDAVASMLHDWPFLARALAYSWLGGVLALVPLWLTLAVTKTLQLSWAVVPLVVIGSVVGVTKAAEKWRRHQRLPIGAAPPNHVWARFVTAGATSGAMLSLAFLANFPALYLIPVAVLPFSVLAMGVMALAAVSKSPSGRVDESTPLVLVTASTSYSTISLDGNIATTPKAPPTAWTMWAAIGGAMALYIGISFHFAVDLAIVVQSIAAFRALLLFLLPALFAPSLHLLVTWFAMRDPRPDVMCVICGVYCALLVAAIAPCL
ncbi:unnamed protein product [Aphanomyces euteiches]|uniref:Peptidase M28 domain-containing protein n=2 Tax=Aphanomyces euteiches TaxID=100861 RepID=A0A6G0XVU6_9STRA|nr:hypothetical protein Ae201684_001109 [Aphanomyces euteiches]KAH9099571.1 hypothetical protein Ae201684P_018584 [Aphanomyces euteiches]KAH9152096.1 hypothetical protein AeRB84_005428 [Aphanomyces euteiches]